MMTLRQRAEELFGKSKRFINLCVKNTFDGLDEFGRIDEDQLAMMKSANELMEEAGEYMTRQAYALDEMGDKLDDLQEEMKSMNRKLQMLIGKNEREEKES